MKLIDTSILGCQLIEPFRHSDTRGEFTKIYHSEYFKIAKQDFVIRETYYSRSKKNVFRGFHFQSPPDDHSKIVFCTSGAVIDFVLDIRKSSLSFGKVLSFSLSEQNGLGLIIPKGCAHGFYSLQDNSIMVYLLETVHSIKNDSGIHWSSVELNYPIKNPLISQRDSSFPFFKDFSSPFS